MNHRLLQFILFIVLLCCEVAYSWEFEFQGRDELRAVFPHKEVNWLTHFKVVVRDCAWLIRTVTEGGLADYVEAGTDGTNTYVITSFVAEVESRQAEGKRLGQNVATSYILPGIVPKFYHEQNLPILWLAFASGCFLRSATNGQLPVLEPILTPDPHNLTELMPATFTASREAPFLPDQVVYFHRGKFPTWENRTHSPWVVKPKMQSYLEPFDRGFTNSIYQVHLTTNLGGVTFPLDSSFSRFLPLRSALTNSDLQLATYHHIVVTNIERRVPNATLMPVVPGPTSASDYRFAVDGERVFGPIKYLFDKQWLDAVQVRNHSNFTAQAANNRRIYNSFGRRR